MSSLSFDNLSSEHLGFWSPIKLKLSPTTIYFKNEKTGKTGHFESKLINTAEWLYRARGFGLCIKLNVKKRHYFDGFAENEFEKVSRYFEENYEVKVKNVETCLKGWNWGKPRFEDEYMEFLIDGMRSFDVNLKDVINASLNKNELTLQFQTSDEAFSIYEMRFATVSTNENVMSEMLYNVSKEANILEASGDALVSLKEMHCLQPRGRYEIKLYQQFIHLRGKTYDYSVPKENFVRFYLLPHPDERQIFFVLQVNPPITHGQTRYYFIILLFNNEDEISVDLNCSDQSLKDNYNGTITKNMTGLTYEVVTKLYKNLYDQKLTVPNKFESKLKARALTCSYKTTAGFLYPLDKGFIFVPKPAVSIRSDEITVVNLSRASSMQRTFDFDIETSNGSTHTFNSIDKSEYNGFLEFIKAKKYVLSSGESMARQEDWSSTDESHDGYLERMKEEGKRSRAKEAKIVVQDDDDDDEDDEDFNPEEAGESDVAEEYDSEVSTSTSSSEGESAGGVATGDASLPKTSRPSKGAPGGGTTGGSSDDNDSSLVDDKRPPAKTKESMMAKKHASAPTGASISASKTKTKTKVEKTTSVAREGGGSKKHSTATATDGKKKKKVKDPNAPKKPMSAFLLFSSDVRDEVKKGLRPSSTVADMAKVIGERWKAITDSEKTKYGNIYKAEYQKYEEAMKLYEKSGGGAVGSGGSTAAAGRGGMSHGAAGGSGGAAAHKGPSDGGRNKHQQKTSGEIVGKLSAGVYKSEEFVESSDTSD